MGEPFGCDDFEDRYDEDGEWGFTEEDCGRWDNGRLSPYCRLAGTEDCDWECPIGLAHKALSNKEPKSHG